MVTGTEAKETVLLVVQLSTQAVDSVSLHLGLPLTLGVMLMPSFPSRCWLCFSLLV